EAESLVGTQLMVVTGIEIPRCIVYVYEKTENGWREVESLMNIPGIMGRDGMAWHTPENAKFTPIGYFGLGPAYGEAEWEDTALEYHQIQRGDYFVIDTNSKYYNQLWKAGRDELDWQYAEEMIEMLEYYALCIYVQKNVNPVVYNEGSAIFVHIDRLDNSTSGCIGVERWVMEALFRWMRADANPHILLYPEP
ncbi:MAG: L,D-transpeptidase family protein, partial [Lachnospiraceae bacterium]|nr:L,D-transpeptidase family protein [Lachnospiraceae bacterium]